MSAENKALLKRQMVDAANLINAKAYGAATAVTPRKKQRMAQNIELFLLRDKVTAAEVSEIIDELEPQAKELWQDVANHIDALI